MYKKVRRYGGKTIGDYYCGVSRAPQPVSAIYTQDFGAAMIYFDDAISGTGSIIGTEQSCGKYVHPVSDPLIGYTEAQCTWRSARHLYLQFGTKGVIGETEWIGTGRAARVIRTFCPERPRSSPIATQPPASVK